MAVTHDAQWHEFDTDQTVYGPVPYVRLAYVTQVNAFCFDLAPIENNKPVMTYIDRTSAGSPGASST
jgi:hypothetical protein